jgi:hypothetical protein
VRCITSYFYLSFIFFSGGLHNKYLGKNWFAHYFTFLVLLIFFEVLAKSKFYLFNPLTVMV